jgi:hypothetical protein
MLQRRYPLSPAGRLFLLRSSFLLLAALPIELIARGQGLCFFKNIFGVECLGCGMTRAMSSLLYAEMAAALAYNKPMMVFPLLCALLLKDLISILQPVTIALSTVFKDRARRD